ncbi:stalk domain-containing protein [Desulfuribacillus alkaliarsenatis]|uniref:Copper amine oxidase-like N-terminal domain-containing protein n=1 Tax=Desulfuribacillus alkaliarsenatis TaxID=766136 RepID=A0A1E5G5L3_9FIRM|nr:stalk domain-containing protein [Desulfuribacillus alkaliarsenatis]OEF98385.1 hypothetical protein BHF68_01525 [Desulfuribacillus alkaliarsenatis]
MRKIVQLCLMIAILIIFTAYADANEREIRIYVDGKQVNFIDAKPYIDSNYRTMVPVRFPAEAVGAEVSWDNHQQKVTAIKNDRIVELTAGSREYNVNGLKMMMDTEMVYNSSLYRNFVPIRFVLEGLGAKVDWARDDNDIIVYVYTDSVSGDSLDEQVKYEKQNNQEKQEAAQDVIVKNSIFSVSAISIGDSLTSVNEKLGAANRIEPSIYDYNWHVYNSDYNKYVKLGIKNNRVVSFLNVIELDGYTRTSIRKELGSPLKYIQINNTRYMQSSSDYDVFLVGNNYVYVYYDQHENDEVIAIKLLERASRDSLRGFLPQPTNELKNALSLQIFDLANAMRVSKGLSVLRWSDAAAFTSEKHSIDMATKDYFSHTNLQGLSPFDRMRNDGISFRGAAENLAAGQPDAITAHVGWMNSWGHREALISNQQFLGVGTAYGGSYGVYYTQKFFSR